MGEERRSRLTAGILMVIIGVALAAVQLVPGLSVWLSLDLTWPWFVIGAGGILLIIGLLVGAPEMAIPAVIVSGIGAILYWQNHTGNWGSWAYIWALIPGFSGLGMVLSRLLGSRDAKIMGRGLQLMLTSAIMFVIFSSFLGGWRIMGSYWPLLLIAAGALLMGRAFFNRSN